MGWLFVRGATQEDIIRQLTASEDNAERAVTTIAHRVYGNVLWTVDEITFKDDGDHKQRVIHCNLLNQQGADWGYKNIPEQMHPYYYSCPIAFLDMAPVACEKWRQGVMQYHQQRQQ